MSDIDDLERLHALHVSGALTETEYADRKARLLAADDWMAEEDEPRRRRRYWPFIALLGFIVFVIIALLASGTVAVDKASDQRSQNLEGPSIANEPSALVSQPQLSAVPSNKATAIKPDATDFRQAEWPGVAGLSPSLLDQYPAEPFDGLNVAPKFTGDQKEFREFRSTFASEAKLGPNFNGHYRVIFVGCGAHCTFNFILDEATGKTLPLVVNGDGGGEESLLQDFRYYPGSSLIAVAAANANKSNECIYSIYRWQGGDLDQLSQRAIQLPNGEENYLGGCDR